MVVQDNASLLLLAMDYDLMTEVKNKDQLKNQILMDLKNILHKILNETKIDAALFLSWLHDNSDPSEM